MAHLAHYKEAHPKPFRVTHWINLVCMFALILSGIYIHFPYFPYFESVARGVHILCGFVIFINCVIRILMSFFIKAAPAGGTRKKKSDIWMWLPQKDNRHQAVQWVKYYLFMRKTHPLGGKLGVPQKISYLLIPLLIIIMFITGLCIWAPTQQSAFCMALNNLVGGTMSMRIIHYFLMFVFIIFCFIHLYLANVEGIEPSKLILFGKEHGGLVYDPDKHIIVGYDEMDGKGIRPLPEIPDSMIEEEADDAEGTAPAHAAEKAAS